MSDWFGTKWVYSCCHEHCGITHSRDGIASLKAGVDLEMPFPVMRSRRVIDQVRSGELDERYVDTAVRRMIETASKTAAPLARLPERAFDNDRGRSLICRQAAAEGMVLLRNEEQLLPLRADANILVVGEHADRPSISGGGSALLNPPYVSAPLDAIQRATSGKVAYHPGIPTWRLVPELDTRFTEEVSISLTNAGEEAPLWKDRRPKASISLLDQRIPGLGPDFTTTLEAQITPVESGTHTLSVFCVAETHVYLDDALLATFKPPHVSVEQFLFERFDFENLITVDLEADKAQTLRVESKSKVRTGHEPPAQGLRVGLVKDVDVDAALEQLDGLAAQGDHVVVMTGLNPDWEGEGSDRVDLRLPRQQEEMLRRLAKHGHKVVLVNQSGGPVDLTCADGISSVVQAFYGGMECGNGQLRVPFLEER
jgi:beta-glucosidase